jgi:CHAT domain-containing protein
VTRRLSSGASLLSLALLGAAIAPAPVLAQGQPLSVRNSFRVGNAGVLCTAQNAADDNRLSGMFDRSYRLTCRDAAGAVGSLVALHREAPLGSVPNGMGVKELACGEVAPFRLDQVGAVLAQACRDQQTRVDYRRYLVRRDGVTWLVEGLSGYDPVLRLALASVLVDRPVPGEIHVATTEVSDPAALARIQAGQLDRLGARNEGYLRNNGGHFAESAEFFQSLAARSRSAQGTALAEALANEGLQQSNLGAFGTAARLFDESNRALRPGDGLTQRLLRNYRAIDRLNQQDPQGAIAALAIPVEPVAASFDLAKLAVGEIDMPLAEQINRENAALKRLGGIDPGLTSAERAAILDAQALALSGSAARAQGRLDDARTALITADRQLQAIHGGRVISTRWLQSEIAIELALAAEAQGRNGDASGSFDRAIAILTEAFPQSPALLTARARKAAFLARSGDSAGARTLFASVIDDSAAIPDSGASLRDLLGPYFAVLSADAGAGAAAELFTAAQVLQRPGVAQTQAVLAREFSEGNDDASAMFRLSVARSREIARTEVEVARLSAIAAPNDREADLLRRQQELLDSLRQDQTALVSTLSAYPRYKVLAPQRVALTELQQALWQGEAYYKLIAVDDDLYALYVDSNAARAWKVDLTKTQLGKDVQTLRDSIVKIENGRQVNYPFDVELSRKLYVKLFGPVDASLPSVRHLIFEPDAAMLQLPPSVLVTADKGVADYLKRSEAADADPFDFTGVEWLGRNREVSIAVSPRGFLDIRKLAPSHAARPYLGVGHNAIPQARPVAAVADECDWPLATWQHPISSDELLFAQKRMGAGSMVLTDKAFSDSNLLGAPQLDQYRVLHFATHGLVTAPRADCPARPALVTSFGDQGSDGLLSFREIFDLKLDADLVILSACDTAGMASVSASREAGVATGGNYALDGLVRAFVGAGARSVVASHWPVPDDFDATKRLIAGMIDTTPGKPLAGALMEAEQRLMDDPRTSHPFYWAAFIVLGDGAKPLMAGTASADAGADRVQTGAVNLSNAPAR